MRDVLLEDELSPENMLLVLEFVHILGDIVCLDLMMKRMSLQQ